jgi:hypothetical protein
MLRKLCSFFFFATSKGFVFFFLETSDEFSTSPGNNYPTTMEYESPAAEKRRNGRDRTRRWRAGLSQETLSQIRKKNRERIAITRKGTPIIKVSSDQKIARRAKIALNRAADDVDQTMSRSAESALNRAVNAVYRANQRKRNLQIISSGES